MFHPTYVWMFFNWYFHNWWVINKSSCVKGGSVKVTDLERVVKSFLFLDHHPRIDDERANEPNVGNIVSIFIHYGFTTLYS